MRYHVLATDYDGTLAHDGVVAERTVEALERLGASGRKLVLVTGRELDDLIATFPRLDVFDRVVAENGALLYDPRSRAARSLGTPPDPRFVAALEERGVRPLSVGRVIVATWEPHQQAVLDTIKALGLELQLTFNKGAVMVLPAGITKASGLQAALDELGVSPHNAVAVGDAENDHAFLARCEVAVAVENALPMLKDRADLVTAGARGEGVVELVERLLADDLRSIEPALSRHEILLGQRIDPTEAAVDASQTAEPGERAERVAIQPYGRNLLVSGPSGSGKSNLTTGMLERLASAGYQFCLIDPEGDYAELSQAVVLGDVDRAPSAAEAFEVLASPSRSVVLNLLAVPLDDRPAFCQALLPRIEELRGRTGRPHWVLIDEAHHLLPASWQPAPQTLPRALESTLLVTVHPDRVSPAALASVSHVLAVGGSPHETLAAFARAVQGAGRDGPAAVPDAPLPDPLAAGTAVMWQTDEADLVVFRVAPSSEERGRHRRKYAAGELPAERAFFFRGPSGRLNLKAQNLQLFLQVGDGVDDDTWGYHLERGDYSRWMREMIKDEDLAEAVAAIERRGGTAEQTRSAIRDVVEQRYTAPA